MPNCLCYGLLATGIVRRGSEGAWYTPVLRVVRQLARDSGMTMLIVTHEMSFARDVSNRVVFMEHGLVAEQGPPEVIFRNPRNDRTRAFLQAILER